MRVINLDDTGIKLLNDKKNQIYLKKEDLCKFITGDYQLTTNSLIISNKTLLLSQTEVKDFPIILNYIKNEILKIN